MANFFKKSLGLMAALLIIHASWAQSAAFNQNASRSNHSRLSVVGDSALQNGLPGQNNNTVRSNRSELMETLTLADMDGDGTFESEIKAGQLDSIRKKGISVIVVEKPKASSISNVLKTKHDTAKNSIGNIR